MRALPFFMLLSRTACRPVSPMCELHQFTASFHPDQLSSPFHSCARCIQEQKSIRGSACLPIHTSARDASTEWHDHHRWHVLPIHTSARDASRIALSGLERGWFPIHTSARDASVERGNPLGSTDSQSILPREMHRGLMNELGGVKHLPIHTSARDASANISKKMDCMYGIHVHNYTLSSVIAAMRSVNAYALCYALSI